MTVLETKIVNGIILHRKEDGLWRDKYGTIWGFLDTAASVDQDNVCGIGAFSLPVDDPLNAACFVHDQAYSNPTYQTFHSREEVDQQLYDSLEKAGAGKPLSNMFYKLARVFGRFFWEKKETR